jgi:hydroxymethylglutaryl-CoA reductase
MTQTGLATGTPLTPMTTDEKARPSSRIAGFYSMGMEERLATLRAQDVLDDADVALLSTPGGLPLETADKMIENVIGVLELPMALGLNFLINGKDYLVPMAVEEPSIVAAVSHVAKIVREGGGFAARCESNLMIGQVQVMGCPDMEGARRAVLGAKAELLELANSLHPNMRERGGGAQDIEVRILDEGRYRRMLVVHLLIDCCDAMGANLINTMAEGIASRVEELTGGEVFLRILSNLADRRLVKATCRIPFEQLAWKSYSGQEVAEGIELASQFAELDPYRAATHNKGIMNGIGAVCLATGNDWRAIEAGAHAYCARDGRYRPMATWRVEDGHLLGALEIPMQVGTVGGPILLHPKVKLAHKILAISGAAELAEVMGAVGLAQNMAAVKALATIGIQKGHMSLHARSVAATAGASTHEMEQVVRRLIECKEIKLHRARQILVELRGHNNPDT